MPDGWDWLYCPDCCKVKVITGMRIICDDCVRARIERCETVTDHNMRDGRCTYCGLQEEPDPQ